MKTYEFELSEIINGQATLKEREVLTTASHPAKPTGTYVYHLFYPKEEKKVINVEDLLRGDDAITAP